MRKMWRKGIVSAAAAALLIQSLAVPAAADATISFGDTDSSVPSVFSADITVNGNLEIPDGGELDLEGNFTVAVDREAGAESVSGTVATSGMTMNFNQYLDENALLLKIPFVSKVLSYSYREPVSSPIADPYVQKLFNGFNSILQLYYAEMFDEEAMQAFGEELMAAYGDFFSTIEFTPAPKKNCMIGGEPVLCDGVQTVIDADLIRDFVNRLMPVTLPHGQTVEDYYNMVLDISDQYDEIEGDVHDVLEDALAEMEDEFTLFIYLRKTDSGAYTGPAEISLTANGSTLALEFRGGAKNPYSEIALVDSYDEYRDELALVNIEQIGDNAWRCALTFEGEQAAVLTLNSDLSWELMVNGLEGPVTGNFAMEDGAAVINAAYQNFTVSIRAHEGGEVVKPEGTVFELSTATEEELESLFSMFSY